MSDYNLIVKDLQEVVGKDLLRSISKKRIVKVYWGTAPTGRIHIGYYIPLLKIAQLLQAGCKVKILIADLHALLDNLKSTEKQVEYRTEYYTKALKVMLQRLNVDLDRIKFVLGSSFQKKPEYTMDVYRLNTLCDLRQARHAGAEVVKQARNPKMTSLLYPSLQALDEEYLKVDAQLGGIDQRKIFMFARDFLPKLGYRKRVHLLTRMVPGLRTTKSEEVDEIKDKMSASNENTKLDMMDNRQKLKRKINKAYCLPGDVNDNSVLELLKNVLFPLLEHLGKKFEIYRSEEHGGPVTFTDYPQVEAAYSKEELHPADLKFGVVNWLDYFIEPVRKEFETREWQQILKHAYNNE